MYCYKCGKQIEDDSIYCPFCGVPLKEEPTQTPKKEAKPKTIKKETPKKQEEVINTTTQTNPNSNKTLGIIFAAIAAVVALSILGYVFLFSGKSINALKGTELVFQGYNGYGQYAVTYDEDEMDTALLLLEQEIDELNNEFYNVCSLTNPGTSKCIELQEKAYYLAEGLSSLDYTVEVSGDKPVDALSNGDTVTIKVQYNKDFFKKAGYKLTNTSKKFKVSGLEEPQEADLIQYVEPKWMTSGGEFYLGTEVSGDSPLEDIPCSISEPDESGNVTITIIDSELGRYGYKVKPGNNSKTAYVGQKPQRLDYMDDSNRDIIENLVFDVLREVHIGKCGWNLYTEKGAELIYGLEKDDITSLSVNWGTVSATVNIRTDKGSTYRKSISFEAYIDQDGKYVCSTDFDTDSLGCSVRGSQWPDRD